MFTIGNITVGKLDAQTAVKQLLDLAAAMMNGKTYVNIWIYNKIPTENSMDKYQEEHNSQPTMKNYIKQNKPIKCSIKCG
ncbi:MAG TPA: hypothetical protein VFP49_05555 [Nitrososphaeraceae archaeon]|nr:hypothetical protein [Nitrososphaeraceae archaeon]